MQNLTHAALEGKVLAYHSVTSNHSLQSAEAPRSGFSAKLPCYTFQSLTIGNNK
jgi:hypothetical protein